MIKDGYNIRVARFVGEYCTMNDGSPVPPDPRFLRQSLQAMIRSGRTREDIRREALEKQDVLISDELFGGGGGDG